MQRFILARLLQGIVTLFIVSMVVFALARLAGNPLEIMLPTDSTQAEFDSMAALLGLDKPIPVQYWYFLQNAVHGNLGESLRFHKPALEVVLQRLPATLQLGVIGFVLAMTLAIPIGVYSARNRGTVLDNAARGFAVVGQSMPHFALGIILILVFAVWLHLLPASGKSGPQSYVLPAITLGYYATAGVMRLTRSAMLDVLDSEYIKLARSKGLRESVVMWKHAFKNALIPVLTFSTLIFIRVLIGSVVTETVFAWPGTGRLAVESISFRDYPVVQTVVLIWCTMFIIGNLTADILYSFANPKIRYQKK